MSSLSFRAFPGHQPSLALERYGNHKMSHAEKCKLLGILVCKPTCRVLSSFLSRQTYMSRAIREEICSGMIKTITNVILHAAHTDLAPHGWCARVFDNEIPLLGSFKHNRGLNITFLFNLFKQKFSLQFCSLEFMCFVTYLHFCLLACRPTFE